MSFKRTASSQGPMALLDIGTSKIACLIVADDGQGPIATRGIAGFGHQRSRGVKAGVIVDMDEAEKAVRAAIGQAERMAGVRVGEVVLSVSCGRLKSLHYAAEAQIETGIVQNADVARVFHAGEAYACRDGRSLIHLNALGYRLDGSTGVRAPAGMVGNRLAADLHAVTADDAPLRNLLLLVERCHLATARLVPASLASGLAVLTADERKAGVTCVDIGSGTSAIASFVDGHLVGVDTLPVGGQHITFDLARALSTPLEEAERIKTLYGTLLAAASDEHEAISYTLVAAGASEPYQVSRAYVRQVIQARMAAILGLVSERLKESCVHQWVGSRIVLTGGVAQTLGLADFAEDCLGAGVRLARPAPVSGLSESFCSPALSTVIGLAAATAPDVAGLYPAMGQGNERFLGRMRHWLRESF